MVLHPRHAVVPHPQGILWSCTQYVKVVTIASTAIKLQMAVLQHAGCFLGGRRGKLSGGRNDDRGWEGGGADRVASAAAQLSSTSYPSACYAVRTFTPPVMPICVAGLTINPKCNPKP